MMRSLTDARAAASVRENVNGPFPVPKKPGCITPMEQLIGLDSPIH
jgi:hypothetical protein